MSKVWNPQGLEQLDEKLAKLDTVTCHNLMFNAIKVGAGVLKYNTQLSLTTKMGFKATKKLRGRNVSLADGVKMKHDNTLCESKVSITGFSRWFEVGTDIRKTKKGYNRGQITGLNFFFAARQSSDGEINSAIASSIEKQLNRIMK